MRRIYRDVQCVQLLLQAQRRHRIAQKQVLGVFIIDKIAHGIRVGKRAALPDRFAVVGSVFDDLHPVGAEQVLFPLLGVHAHVDDDPVADVGGGDADAQAQIAGGAHLHGVAGEKLPQLRAGQPGIVVRLLQQTVAQRQLLRVLEHLIDAAPGLDGAGDGEMTVLLQQQTAGKLHGKAPLQRSLHPGDGRQGRFDDAALGRRLGKADGDEGCKPGQPGLGVPNVRHGKLHAGEGLRRRAETGVDPADLLCRRHPGQNGVALQQRITGQFHVKASLSVGVAALLTQLAVIILEQLALGILIEKGAEIFLAAVEGIVLRRIGPGLVQRGLVPGGEQVVAPAAPLQPEKFVGRPICQAAKARWWPSVRTGLPSPKSNTGSGAKPEKSSCWACALTASSLRWLR